MKISGPTLGGGPQGSRSGKDGSAEAKSGERSGAPVSVLLVVLLDGLEAENLGFLRLTEGDLGL